MGQVVAGAVGPTDQGTRVPAGDRRLFWDHPHESREHADPLWGLPEGLWLLLAASPARKIFKRLLSILSLFTCAGNPKHASKDRPEWKPTFLDLQSTAFYLWDHRLLGLPCAP